MIALIRGTILNKTTDAIIIETGGIGYRIFMPLTALSFIQTGETKEIHTHLHVREDALLLYGFLAISEKELFIKLLNVSGLGPKTALSVISHLPVEAFLRAIEGSDADAFAKVPGIGKKTAQRIILELKGKINFEQERAEGATDENNAMVAAEGLQGLGYTKADIKAAFTKIQLSSLSAEEIIKQALKILAKV